VIKKYIKSFDNLVPIVTHFPHQQSLTDEHLDLSCAYLNPQATQSITTPPTVAAHADGGKTRHWSLLVVCLLGIERKLPRQHTARPAWALPEGEAVSPGTSLFSINGLPITDR
jgi:hypothetical protein